MKNIMHFLLFQEYKERFIKYFNSVKISVKSFKSVHSNRLTSTNCKMVET